jgi:hypothetical protein
LGYFAQNHWQMKDGIQALVMEVNCTVTIYQFSEGLRIADKF